MPLEYRHRAPTSRSEAPVLMVQLGAPLFVWPSAARTNFKYSSCGACWGGLEMECIPLAVYGFPFFVPLPNRHDELS